MSDTLFISDLHLDSSRPAVTQALLRFLANNANCHSLYILGDLFEVWLGDDDDSPLATDLADALSRFTDQGPALYLMQGNRDFLLGKDFSARVGAKLLQDPTVIDLYGTPTLLMHGDSLCTADSQYQAFRATARDPVWQAELLSKTLDERRAFAQQLRATSKEANSNKAADIMDVTESEVERVMAEFGTSLLIHGHTHRPRRHEHPTGTRLVLGDWEQQGWAIRATPLNIDLFNFDINQ